METSAPPSWRQTVASKRQIRDHAIQSFVAAHPDDIASPPIDQVSGILHAITSGAVTSSQLCTAYIQR